MPEPVEIAMYTYHLFSSREDDDVVLFLYDERSTLMAQLCFVPDEAALPPATEEKGKYTLYYRRSQLAEVLDLLRNEGPVYLSWGGGSDTTLATGYEPIGEGEIVESRERRAGVFH